MGAHYWGRENRALGHEYAVIPRIYVKPFRKWQKNDANDAAAIVEAAQRPTMRFVALKLEAVQAEAAVFRTRGLLVRQRTQLVNALRGPLMEFGIVAAIGLAKVEELQQEMEQAKSCFQRGSCARRNGCAPRSTASRSRSRRSTGRSTSVLASSRSSSG